MYFLSGLNVKFQIKDQQCFVINITRTVLFLIHVCILLYNILFLDDVRWPQLIGKKFRGWSKAAQTWVEVESVSIDVFYTAEDGE
jgi:hypothetical protein